MLPDHYLRKLKQDLAEAMVESKTRHESSIDDPPRLATTPSRLDIPARRGSIRLMVNPEPGPALTGVELFVSGIPRPTNVRRISPHPPLRHTLRHTT